MPIVDIYSSKREKVGTINLSEAVFAADLKPHLLHEVVIWQLAKRRHGNACTKSRHDVRGGGKKPWRQKGTGRARVGSRRTPIWRGGGVAFGPKPRNYSYTIPKKVKKAALCVALSDKLREEKLLILRNFDLLQIKTKFFVEILQRLEVYNALIVTAQPDEILEKSARNVPKIKVLRIQGLNVYDILRYDRLVLMESAVIKIEETLS